MKKELTAEQEMALGKVDQLLQGTIAGSNLVPALAVTDEVRRAAEQILIDEGYSPSRATKMVQRRVGKAIDATLRRSKHKVGGDPFPPGVIQTGHGTRHTNGNPPRPGRLRPW